MSREIRKNQTFKIGLVYFVISFMIGLSYIVKVFFIEGCYAFESNYEVAHTFIEIELASKMLREGVTSSGLLFLFCAFTVHRIVIFMNSSIIMLFLATSGSEVEINGRMSKSIGEKIRF